MMTFKPGNTYRALACTIVCTAIVLRAIWASQVAVMPVSDGKAYLILARTLADYGVYGWDANVPSAFWPPGTSAVYAALFLIFGQQFESIVVLNIILSAGTVALTMWLAKLLFDERTSLFAGLLMAIWPSEVAYVTVLASEIPFTFCVLLGCICWFGAGVPISLRAVASGLAFGAATYFRPIALLLPIVLWVSTLPQRQKKRGTLQLALCAMLIVIATVAPWSVRNTHVFGHFLTMTTADGVNLWMGNNAKSDGYYMSQPAMVQGLNEYEQNRILTEDALLYIVENPGTFIVRAIKKAALLHAVETTAISWNTEGIKKRFGEDKLFPLKLVTQGFWAGILLLAAGGIAILVRGQGAQALLNPTVLIWVYFTAVYSVFVVVDRYHFPSHPFIAMLAAIALVAVVSKFAHRRT